MKGFKKALIVFGAVLLVGYIGLTIGYNLSRNESQASPTVKSERIDPAAIYNIVNERRAKATAPLLAYSEALVMSAKTKCKDMTKYNYYNHKNPKTKKQGYTLIFDEEPKATIGSENLNEGRFANNEQIVHSWMKSAPHKAAILDPEYTHSGVAVCKAKDGQTLVVQHFATIKY